MEERLDDAIHVLRNHAESAPHPGQFPPGHPAALQGMMPPPPHSNGLMPPGPPGHMPPGYHPSMPPHHMPHMEPHPHHTVCFVSVSPMSRKCNVKLKYVNPETDNYDDFAPLRTSMLHFQRT